jgi:hypothetical protein
MLTRVPQDRLLWGWARLFLGFTQMALVGMSVGALITVGLKPITWVFVIAATSLALLSRIIYRGRRSPESKTHDRR